MESFHSTEKKEELFMCNLLNYAISIGHCIEINDWMIVVNWKDIEVAAAYVKVVSCYMTGRTEENHKKHQNN